MTTKDKDIAPSVSTAEPVQNAPQKKKRPRVWELDFLRGLSILLVCWDHLMYDAWDLFGSHFESSGNAVLASFSQFAADYWSGDLRAFFRPVFLFIFFFVSGICVSFSRNNIFRALKLVVAALVVNLGTYLASVVLGFNCFIIFGVVHSFAVIVLIYALVEWVVKLILKKCNKPELFKYVMSAVLLAIVIVGITLDAIYNVSITDFDNRLSTTIDGEFIGLIFFKYGSLWSKGADYFPLFPFFNYFFIGALISPWIYPNKKSLLPMLDHKWHYPFTIPGRVSLYIYILVQVIAIVLLGLISLIVTGSIGII